jgi:hypothetical protein
MNAKTFWWLPYYIKSETYERACESPIKRVIKLYYVLPMAFFNIGNILMVIFASSSLGNLGTYAEELNDHFHDVLHLLQLLRGTFLNGLCCRVKQNQSERNEGS